MKVQVNIKLNKDLKELKAEFNEFLSQFPARIRRQLPADWRKLFSKQFRRIEREPDHGVVGGVLLLGELEAAIRKKYHGSADDKIRKNIDAWYQIALSVMMHNFRHPKHLQQGISFEEYPFVCLLQICDEIQDWSRVLTPMGPLRTINYIQFNNLAKFKVAKDKEGNHYIYLKIMTEIDEKLIDELTEEAMKAIPLVNTAEEDMIKVFRDLNRREFDKDDIFFLRKNFTRLRKTSSGFTREMLEKLIRKWVASKLLPFKRDSINKLCKTIIPLRKKIEEKETGLYIYIEYAAGRNYFTKRIWIIK